MNLVGMLWNRNEGDILEEVVRDAATKVDALYCADGHSTDGSWETLQRLHREGVVAHIQQGDETRDRAQRNSLLQLIRSRHKPEDTWVQVFESDVFVMDTDIREAIRDYAVADVAVTWFALNACRIRWEGADDYPHWRYSIRTVMPYAHYMEEMLYTFRPLPELSFDQAHWRPWPSGFSKYTSGPVKQMPCGPRQPLLLHVGYRGPTHFWHKYRHMGTWHTKYKTWRVDSPEAVNETVSFFNGEWNGEAFPATRGQWLASTYGRCDGPDSCGRYHGRPDRAADHHRQPDGLAGAAEAGPQRQGP
jgi:hypothetical protein